MTLGQGGACSEGTGSLPRRGYISGHGLGCQRDQPGRPVWGRSLRSMWEDGGSVRTECMSAQRDCRAGYKTGTRSAAIVLFHWALLSCPAHSPALPHVPGRKAAYAQGSAEGQRPQPGSQAP